MGIPWWNKKINELESNNKMLVETLKELDRDIEMLKFKVEPSKESSIDRHFDRMRNTIKKTLNNLVDVHFDYVGLDPYCATNKRRKSK